MEELIPRIYIKHHNEHFIEWNRQQLQVTPAFPMSINKCQYQTHKVVAVEIEEPTLSHGQLYVAATSVADPQLLHFEVIRRVSRTTRNIIYEKILRTVVAVSTPTEVPLPC